ncbi:hypothetical protein ACHWQZ_G009094 [Mnemiopsis leidyi]
MTEVFERSASSSSESDSDTYTSSESDVSYTDTEEVEREVRSVGELVVTSEDEEDESMIVKSGVEDVPVTLTETKYENASVVQREKANENIPPSSLYEEVIKESSEVVNPTLDGQQLKWTATIETEQTGIQIPDIKTEQSVTIIQLDSDTSSLDNNSLDKHPVITENIETEDFGKLRSTRTNITETESNSHPIYENMSKSHLLSMERRSRVSSSSSSSSISSRTLSHSETRGFDQKTYILEKPTVAPPREEQQVIKDTDTNFRYQNNKPPVETVEFEGSDRDIDYEINSRRPSSPYSTILDLEVDEDDIGGRNAPDGMRKAPPGVTPIAAGVKTSRPSITPGSEQSKYKPESPVYSVVNKKKIVHSDDSIVRPYNYNDTKLDGLQTKQKEKKEPKKNSIRNPLKLSIFGKSKDKKAGIKRQISGPVGQVVHYSGQSDTTQMRTLGVGIYEEGARTGIHPAEEIRPTGQVEIVNFTPDSDEDDMSDPTLHQTMFIDLEKERAERHAMKRKKKSQKKVTIVTNGKGKDESDSELNFQNSMFSDVEIKQKPIPSPLLEPNYEIDPPARFRDNEKPPRPKQKKPPRKAVSRQISKEDIGLPQGSVLHENGKSSPELMDAFGIEVKGRSTPDLEDKPKIIKSNNTAVRSDSILDLRDRGGRRSSEPVLTSSEEEGRKRRGRGSRRKSSPGEFDRRRRRKSSEPELGGQMEKVAPQKPTPQSRNDAYMSLVKNQIPGLENVEPTVIEKYVKTLVSLPDEEYKPAQKSLNIQSQQVQGCIFDPEMIEQYISHMQRQQKQRGIRTGELDFFDPKVLRKYRKLTTNKTSPKEKAKKPDTENDLRRKSQDIFNQRRASIGKFLANPENRRRSESFTYLKMADNRGPWYKEDGQQDKGLTNDDLLAGRRVSSTPKKDPRFPDYYKRPAAPVQRSHSTTALDNHLKARLLSSRRSEGNLRHFDTTSSSSTMPDRYRKLIKTPEDFDPPERKQKSRDRRLSEEKHLVNKPRRHRSERQRDRHDGRRKSRDSQEEKVYSISTIGRNGTFDSHKTYDSHADRRRPSRQPNDVNPRDKIREKQSRSAENGFHDLRQPVPSKASREYRSGSVSTSENRSWYGSQDSLRRLQDQDEDWRGSQGSLNSQDSRRRSSNKVNRRANDRKERKSSSSRNQKSRR